MKKCLNILVILFITCFIGVINVNAANFGKITGGNTNGTTFKVPITGANGLVFSYDTAKLSCFGENTAIYDQNGIKGRLISNDNVEISCTINSNEYSNLNLILKDVNQYKDSVGITYEINTSLKPTTTTTTVAPTTKPTTTTQKKSNNANLKTLEIKVIEKTRDENKTTTTTKSSKTTSKQTTTQKASTTEVIELVKYTPEFKADIYEYSATVSGDVKKISINATMEDSKANMIISDNLSQELKSGENNKFIITVTAEDGTKKAYTINIKREALKSDATLKELTIEEDPKFSFSPDKFTYKVNVKKSVKKLTIAYELNDSTSKVDVIGNEDLEDGSRVKLLVTAEDGTKKEYILNIIKEVVTTTSLKESIPAEKNPLIIMGLSVVAFGLIGAIIYVAKK